jgi:hypothetical protein
MTTNNPNPPTQTDQTAPAEWLVALFNSIPEYHQPTPPTPEIQIRTPQSHQPTLPNYDLLFERLQKALHRTPLPLSDQTTRYAQADEFYCMLHTQELTQQTIPFKHRDSRNYLYLRPDNSLFIPTEGPFHRGTFDLNYK